MHKIVSFLIITFTLVAFVMPVCNGQGKVVNDPGEGPKLLSKKSFGSLLKEKFKDSIAGLDSMTFMIVVDKKGYAKKVEYMDDYFAPKITQANLNRIINYINHYMRWQAAWVPRGKGVRNFDCTIYESVSIDTINKILSKPYNASPKL